MKSINRVLWLRSNLGVKSQSLSNLVLSDLKTLSLLMQQNSDRYNTWALWIHSILKTIYIYIKKKVQTEFTKYFCVHEADQVAPTKTFGGL